MEFALAHSHGKGRPQERRRESERMAERAPRVPRSSIPADDADGTGCNEGETELPGKGKLFTDSNDTNERNEFGTMPGLSAA